MSSHLPRVFHAVVPNLNDDVDVGFAADVDPAFGQVEPFRNGQRKTFAGGARNKDTSDSGLPEVLSLSLDD